MSAKDDIEVLIGIALFLIGVFILIASWEAFLVYVVIVIVAFYIYIDWLKKERILKKPRIIKSTKKSGSSPPIVVNTTENKNIRCHHCYTPYEEMEEVFYCSNCGAPYCEECKTLNCVHCGKHITKGSLKPDVIKLPWRPFLVYIAIVIVSVFREEKEGLKEPRKTDSTKDSGVLSYYCKRNRAQHLYPLR